MDSKGKSDDTPKKFNSNSGCVFCGCELTDSWKWTKLNGKVSVNVDGYICNKCCYQDLKHLEKILEDAKSLQQSLQEKFTANN